MTKQPESAKPSIQSLLGKGVLLFAFVTIISALYFGGGTPTGNVVETVAVDRGIDVQNTQVVPKRTILAQSYCPENAFIGCESVLVSSDGVYVKFVNIAKEPLGNFRIKTSGGCSGEAYAGDVAVGARTVIKVCDDQVVQDQFEATLDLSFTTQNAQIIRVALFGRPLE